MPFCLCPGLLSPRWSAMSLFSTPEQWKMGSQDRNDLQFAAGSMAIRSPSQWRNGAGARVPRGLPRNPRGEAAGSLSTRNTWTSCSQDGIILASSRLPRSLGGYRAPPAPATPTWARAAVPTPSTTGYSASSCLGPPTASSRGCQRAALRLRAVAPGSPGSGGGSRPRPRRRRDVR